MCREAAGRLIDGALLISLPSAISQVIMNHMISCYTIG